MRASRVLLFIIGVALVLSSTAYLVPSVAFYPVSAILLIVGVVLCASFWIISSPVGIGPITKATEFFSRDEVTKMRPKVEGAALGFTSSRAGVAAILRQRLVNNHYGAVTPAWAWASAREERPLLLDILGDKADLVDVFEPPERNEPRSRFLRRPPLDIEYIEKLERALSFLEEGES